MEVISQILLRSILEEETLEKAQSIEGPIVKQFKNWAAEYKVWLSLGGF